MRPHKPRDRSPSTHVVGCGLLVDVHATDERDFLVGVLDQVATRVCFERGSYLEDILLQRRDAGGVEDEGEERNAAEHAGLHATVDGRLVSLELE